GNWGRGRVEGTGRGYSKAGHTCTKGAPPRWRALRYDISRRTLLAVQARNVLSRRTLLALHDVELHRLTFGQRLEAAALDGRMMDEAILLSIGRRDEAETLRIVEP